MTKVKFEVQAKKNDGLLLRTHIGEGEHHKFGKFNFSMSGGAFCIELSDDGMWLVPFDDLIGSALSAVERGPKQTEIEELQEKLMAVQSDYEALYNDCERNDAEWLSTHNFPEER